MTKNVYDVKAERISDSTEENVQKFVSEICAMHLLIQRVFLCVCFSPKSVQFSIGSLLRKG